MKSIWLFLIYFTLTLIWFTLLSVGNSLDKIHDDLYGIMVELGR